MENVTGFAVEAEETNEAAAPNAIDVTEKTEGTGVALLEKQVNMPLIPDVLNINGLDVSEDELKVKIENIKKMKIDGLGDEDGYNKAVEELTKIRKLRTGSETWRKKVTAPINKFTKELKGRTDAIQKMCSEGEDYLDTIIEPIERAVELARIEAENKKDELAEIRSAELYAMGGVLEKGTFQFPYDGAVWILASQLRVLSEEDYLNDTAEIRAAWDTEVARLQAIEDEKNAEQLKLQTQLQDLNAERTEFRKEQLEMKGFESTEDEQIWMQHTSNLRITMNDILNLNAAEWKALLNPAQVAPVDMPEEMQNPATAEEKPKQAPAQTFAPPPAFSSGFAPTVAPEPAKEVEQPVYQHPAEESFTTEELKGITVSIVEELVFTPERPFYVLALTAKMAIHIYPEENKTEATEGLDVPFTANITDSLFYSIIRLS